MVLGQGLKGMFITAIVWEECEPASSDLEVGPGGGDVWAGTKDGVIVIIHDGEGADVDGEDRGEQAQPVYDPGLTVREVATGDGVIAVEEGAADTAGEAVIDADFTIFDVRAARKTHDSPRFNRSNGELMD